MRFYLLIVMYLSGLFIVSFTLTNALISYVLFAILTLLFVTYVAFGVSFMRLNLFLRSICRIDTLEREVALTFDDGPDPELTPQILELLKKYNAKATFFCIGSKIIGNEDLLRQLHHEGHSVGNHTYEHSIWFPIWAVSKMKQSIIKTDEIIEHVIGEKPKLFRPPFGVLNNLIAVAIKGLKKKCVGWTIRTKDTCRTPEEVMRLIKAKIRPGSIVLFHDTNVHIIKELEQTLIYCKENNLEAVALR